MELGVHNIDFPPGAPEALGPALAATAKAAKAEPPCSHSPTTSSRWRAWVVPRIRSSGYTSMGFLAGQTQRITLTMLVTGVTYRYPGVLAKPMTTLHVLAQGRTNFGIGAAWCEREHLALGVPYPSVKDRFKMLEETLQISQQMWSDDDGPYEGKHHQLAETICQPKPLRRPPILIGGDGEKKTLRMVAQYADVWNSTSSVDELPHKLDVLRRHCDAVGRNFSDIRLTAGFFTDPFADLDAYLRRVDQFAALGFDLLNSGPLPGNPDPVGVGQTPWRRGHSATPR